MPEFSKHAPGTFCWVELATTNQAAAKTFYGSLFGWAPEDVPMGPGETYTLLKVAGKDVAALYTMMKEQRDQGVPPNWLPYVSVESADASAEKARSLGGTLLMGAFDVMDIGRMAVVQDPQGAVLAVWQPKSHIGFRLAGDPGTFCWPELQTTDPSAAGRFYSGLFGWTPKTGSGGGMEYTEWVHGGNPMGGMMQIAKEWGPVPPHWLVYFAVSDCDAATGKAKSLGGSLTVPPMDIPNVGRFSVISDPQGAVFALFKPTMPG